MYSVFALSDGGRGRAGFPTISTPVDTVLTIVDLVVSFVPMVRTVVKTTERCHIIDYLPTVAGTVRVLASPVLVTSIDFTQGQPTNDSIESAALEDIAANVNTGKNTV